ncbi:aldo/keto reductase [Actinoplanes utahensis]|uniref:Oxidoreductase n=1 Tax=Actinoplanes utahensis TaxID=1869 RepID=A0A0A6UP72_ACTUT|nr:aldo/keto reductase [Actinoplanes utahensis]KHD76843.1 oxidoreductase [Actinoplanes utahensis]GIF33438.1 oxidoreductase [Actinoplanes utahensis]
MKRLRLAVLGAGNMARRFIPQLSASKHCELTAIGDLTADGARTLAGELGPRERPLLCGTFDDILASDAVDAVYIATVHTTHARIAMRAIEAGKHVLCEKPLAVNHAQAMTLVDAARQAGVRLVEAMMFRFHPQTTAVLGLVADGTIGDLRHVDAGFAFYVPSRPGEQTEISPGLTIDAGGLSGRLFDPALAGGGILDIGCYPMAMARAVAGAATGRAFAEPETLTAAGSIGESGVDEWATAALTFAGGVTAALRTGIRIADRNSVTIVGSAGAIEIEDPWTLTAEPSIVINRVGHAPERRSYPCAGAYAMEADLFAAGIGGPEPDAMTTADSLGNARMLDRWRAAIGLRYPFEADGAVIPTVSGRPLILGGAAGPEPVPATARGRVPGLDKAVSRVVMGCDHPADASTMSALLDQYFSLGGNAFDTAHFYQDGRAERLLGRWIASRGVREQVVVIAKGAHTPNCDPASLSQQLLESLERQQNDYADIYLLHRDNEDVPVGEFVDVLDEHAEAGRIRVFGGSNWSLERVAAANAWAAEHGRRGFAAVSNYFGLAEPRELPWPGCRDATGPAFREWLTRHRFPLFAWSARSRNFFSGAGRDDRGNAELVRCFHSEANLERRRRAVELAAKHDVSPSVIALSYVLHQPFPTFALVGPKTLEDSRECMGAPRVTLSDEEIRWLESS